METFPVQPLCLLFPLCSQLRLRRINGNQDIQQEVRNQTFLFSASAEAN